MNNLKEYLKYVPGFRSGSKIKSIIATIYYFFFLSIFFITKDKFFALGYLALPFAFFYIIDFIKRLINKTHSKKNRLIAIISVFILLGSFTMAGITGELDPVEDEPYLEAQKDEIKNTEVSSDKKVAVKDETKLKKDTETKVEKVVFDGKRDLSVHFINVGQGDSTFISLPNGENVLIDGGPEKHKDTLINYLNSLEFEKIDYLIATHPHEDHIGGLPYIINNWDIGNIYMPNKSHTTKAFENLLNSIDNNNYDITPTSTGTILLEEPGLSLKALAPDTNTSGNDLNDYSIVLRLEYNDNTFMFMADGEALTEQYILADNNYEYLKSDVLKVGHHGSNTSTLPGFLKAVSPTYGIISCGVDNKYNHPDVEVVKRLEDESINIYRTDTNGTIIATSDGSNISFKTLDNIIEKADNNSVDNKKETVATFGDENNNSSKSEASESNNVTSEDSNNSTEYSQTVTGEASQDEVYITPTGKRFHSRPCGKGNYSPTSIEDAEGRGLTPCKRCY